MNAPAKESALLVRAGCHICAFKLPQVVEILRPLPIEEVAHLPEFVRGLSIIRGEPVPVVSLASLLSGGASPPTRFVVVRTGRGRVALSVSDVMGVADLSPAALSALPPLAQTAPETVEAIGALDANLLFVLNSARIVTDEVWRELGALQS